MDLSCLRKIFFFFFLLISVLRRSLRLQMLGNTEISIKNQNLASDEQKLADLPTMSDAATRT